MAVTWHNRLEKVVCYMLKRINALFGAQDMTEGKPMSVLLRFSIPPLLIGNFAQQMYSTVDSIIVGRYVGDKALSSIGTTLPVINLLLVLFMAVSTGAGIMVAQYYGGAKDKESLSRSIGNAMTLVFISSCDYGGWHTSGGTAAHIDQNPSRNI